MTARAIVLSPYTDFNDRRKVILPGLVMISLGMLATPVANSVPALIALHFLAGLGIGCMPTSRTSMVSDQAPTSVR